MWKSSARWLLFVCVFAGSAVAQQRREPHVVRVLDQDGKPVAEAQVTLCSAVDPLGATGEDIVRGTTNASGRVTLALLPPRSYVAFATRERDGTREVTPPMLRRPDTTEVQFGSEPTASPAKLELEGLAPWRTRGPLRLAITVLRSRELVPSIEVGERDAIELPAVPWSDGFASLFVGDVLVHMERIGGSSWAVPAPHEVAVRVLDDAGKPMDGVPIARLTTPVMMSYGSWPSRSPIERHRVATTDAEGRATIPMASPGDPFVGAALRFPGVPFVASLAGYCETWSGFTDDGAYCDQKAQGKGGPKVLTFTLTKAPEIGCRVLGQAIPSRVRAIADFSFPSGTSNYGCRDGIVMSLDAKAEVHWPALSRNHDLLALAVPDVRPPLADDDPFQRLAAATTLVLPPETLQQGEIDLRQLRPLKLQILDPDRGPALGAEVVCCAIGGTRGVPIHSAMHATADRSGRVALPVLPGRWCVFVLHGTAWQKLDLELTDRVDVQQVQLELLPTMAVRVVDAQGAPVAGARFSGGGGSWSSDTDPLMTMLSDVATDLDARLLQAVRTDDKGLARLPFLPCPRVRCDFGANHLGRSSEQCTLRAGDDIVELIVK